MRIGFQVNCSCGAAVVARTIAPETIVSRAHQVRGLVITETCEAGHVVNFTAESITMTELAAASITGKEPQ